jgi:2-dehydro-3-deoxygluconokinase
MNKILCFGELLLRLSPDVPGNWIKDHNIPAFIGGAELNVANALARWKIPVAYCSAVPENYLSASVISSLEKNGIDMSRMIRTGSRIGIYYLAQGTDLKHAEVIYDRAHSSITTLKRGQVDWEKILHGVTWFHFTAITPAISEELASVCEEAVQAASRKNITISVDLNYRSKLWKYGKEPEEIMPSLVKYCHVVMGNIWAAETMLGIRIAHDFVKDKEHCLQQAEITSVELMKKFTSCRIVANTFRFDEDAGLKYYATLHDKKQLYVSKEYHPTDIIDKVGSGDCFMAGLIYGNIKGLGAQETLEFATAAAVDKLSVAGDATTSTVEDIYASHTK